MRRIVAGVSLALGLGTPAAPAQEPQWRKVELGAPVAASAVRLGAPVASLGAPQPAASSARVARGQADDRPPMPVGPPAPNANQPMTLPAPTPFGAPPPTGPFMGVPVEGMPNATSGPVIGMPAPCQNCPPGGGIGFNPGFAPLPGGVFMPEAVPPGMLIYANFEYLLWSIRDANLPPLLTTSNAASFGVLGVGDTRVLFGGNSIDDQARSGGRFTVGGWFTRCQNWGWDVSYFFLADSDTSAAFANPGTAVLARPFVLADGRETSELISFPGAFAGSFAASTTNSLWGVDANLKKNLWLGCRTRLDAITGFRYLRFDEEVRLGETFNALPTITDPAFAGVSGIVMDNFKVTNDFYGGQFGLSGELRHGPWSLNLLTKVAVGTTHQVAEVSGGQVITQGGVAQTFPGLLTQPTNTGRFSQDKFTVVPEVGLNLGWQATNHLKLFVGYNFLYWSSVLRAGDQIDRVVNTPAQPNSNPVRPATFPITQTAGLPLRPAVPLRETDFWAQGLNVGLQLSW